MKYFGLTTKVYYNRHRYASNDSEQKTQKITNLKVKSKETKQKTN